jgi:hypothetical protein
VLLYEYPPSSPEQKYRSLESEIVEIATLSLDDDAIYLFQRYLMRNHRRSSRCQIRYHYP